jgi:hypothetical protein
MGLPNWFMVVPSCLSGAPSFAIQTAMLAPSRTSFSFRTGSFDGEVDSIDVVGFGIAELDGGHAVAMDGELDKGGIGVEARAKHDDCFAVADAFSEELGGSRDSEVSGHFPPDVMKLICFAPDVTAGSGDLVLVGSGVKVGRALDGRRANVVGVRETAVGCGLRESGGSEEAAKQEHFMHVRIVSDLTARKVANPPQASP